jgi:hypothetical protein
MAGSFGFEKDKFDLSMDIGDRVLLPAVRRAEPSTLIIADGFSCKEQIAQATGRHALHTAEVLALAMRNPDLAAEDHPERQMIAARKRAQERSMTTAALTMAAGIVGLGLFAISRSKR